LAVWLLAQGIGPDDVVAVRLKNSTAFLELLFAASHVGAVFLPINYRLSADEVGFIVDNSGARPLIADEEFAAIDADFRIFYTARVAFDRASRSCERLDVRLATGFCVREMS